jgi:hypothetical protein
LVRTSRDYFHWSTEIAKGIARGEWLIADLDEEAIENRTTHQQSVFAKRLRRTRFSLAIFAWLRHA